MTRPKNLPQIEAWRSDPPMDDTSRHQGLLVWTVLLGLLGLTARAQNALFPAVGALPRNLPIQVSRLAIPTVASCGAALCRSL